jgi:hypothetical protein
LQLAPLYGPSQTQAHDPSEPLTLVAWPPLQSALTVQTRRQAGYPAYPDAQRSHAVPVYAVSHEQSQALVLVLRFALVAWSLQLPRTVQEAR